MLSCNAAVSGALQQTAARLDSHDSSAKELTSGLDQRQSAKGHKQTFFKRACLAISISISLPAADELALTTTSRGSLLINNEQTIRERHPARQRRAILHRIYR